MGLIGRREELNPLEKTIHSENFHLCLIYGRLRIGKSTLAKEALKKTKAKTVFFECKNVMEEINASDLSMVFSDSFGFSLPNFAHFEDGLGFLFQRSKEEKIVLVLDEYPYLKGGLKKRRMAFSGL
ncbi:MAG: ATP-binding protein [Candidatus Enteromonas sp.]